MSYPINCFLFICFLVTTGYVSLTKLGVLPNPTRFRYSFSTSSYPVTSLRRPNTPLPLQRALRHQARRYTSSLSTSAHIPQTPAAREETFVECAFYYSILCWKEVRAAISNNEKRLQNKCFMFSLTLVCFVSYMMKSGPRRQLLCLVGSFDAHGDLNDLTIQPLFLSFPCDQCFLSLLFLGNIKS